MEARMRIGYTQSELARLMQVSPSTISKCESYNAINWSLFKLIQLCSILRISLFDVLVRGSFKTKPVIEGGIIALIDDEPRLLTHYHKQLKANIGKTEVIAFSNPVQALGWLTKHQARLIVTDHHMPELDGGQLIQQLSKIGMNKQTPSVIMMDNHDKAVIRKIAKQENAIFIDKNEPTDVFESTVSDILKVA